MRRLFIYKVESTGEEVVLPVTPAGFELQTGRTVEALDMQEAGIVNLPGLRTLLNEPIQCFFPAQQYPFVNAGAVLDPYWYVRKFQSFAENGDVLRFVVSDTAVNEPVLIESITYGESDGTGDVNATIKMRGYRDITAPETERSASSDNLPRAAPQALDTVQQTYTVEPGDSLWSICVRFYGDGSLAYKLAAYNGISNASIIHPGQVLKLPSFGEVSATAPVQQTSPTEKVTEIQKAQSSDKSNKEKGPLLNKKTWSLTLINAGPSSGKISAKVVNPKDTRGSTTHTHYSLGSKTVQIQDGFEVTLKWWGDNGIGCYKAVWNGAVLGSDATSRVFRMRKAETFCFNWLPLLGGGQE